MGVNAFNKLSIDDANFNGKRVLLRLDLNVPFLNGEISDTNRITQAIPTIKKLKNDGAKVIICSHLGKPEKRLSLEPVAKKLSELMGVEVKFLKSENVVDDNVKSSVSNLQNGDIAVLENTRYRAEEEKNDDEFSMQLASLCDVFVTDAFGTCHRKHCSNYGVTKFVGTTYSGYLMKDELVKLNQYIEHGKHPFVTLLGGAKIADKLKVIDKAIDKSDVVLIGGGMAFTFIKAMGGEIGKSMVDDTKLSYCLEMIEKAKKSKKKLLLPIDCVAAKEFPNPITNENIETKVFDAMKIDNDYLGLDIGPETIKLYMKYLKGAKTIIWNGPFGLFENQKFALGTYSMARAMTNEKNAVTVIGGGDSASAVNEFNLSDKFTHISTGGGATLKFLEDEPLPGLHCITDK